jgi:hypothetical protein
MRIATRTMNGRILDQPFSVERLLQVGILVYQGVAAIVLIAALFLANYWLEFPFLGAFFDPTLVFDGVGPSPSSANHWPLHSLLSPTGIGCWQSRGRKSITPRRWNRRYGNTSPAKRLR